MLGYPTIMYMPRSLQPGRPRPHKPELVSDLPASRTIPPSGFCLPGPFPVQSHPSSSLTLLLLSPHLQSQWISITEAENPPARTGQMTHFPEDLIISLDPASITLHQAHAIHPTQFPAKVLKHPPNFRRLLANRPDHTSKNQ